MAPSKATKKTTPVLSSKVKVHRQSHPRPRSTPLPSDWPVASEPPQFSSEQSALTPGSLLQELCSGQDIHINKQALLVPSIPKEKGRYLLILPGLFSFKPLQPSSASSTTTTKGASTAEAKEEALPVLTQTQESEDPIKHSSPAEGNTNQDESDDDSQPPAGKVSTAPTTQNKSTVPQFGTLEGLTTPHPKLRISFPALHKSLVFPGSKVHTSSKYMWLNCAARKKGTVACKGIFSSAIVFGAPQWETVGARDQPLSEEAQHNTTTSLEADETPTHYGGSDRTVDGLWKGSKKKTATNLPSSKISILTKGIIVNEQLSGSLGKNVTTLNPSKSNTPKQLTLDDDEGSSDFDDDDDEYLHDTKVEVVKGRSTPKRQASAKKTKYTVDLLDSDVEDESENEEANTTKASNPPLRQASRRSAAKDASDASVDDDSHDGNDKKKTPRRKANPSTKKSLPDVQPTKKKASNNNKKTIRKQQHESEESSSDKEILAISDEEENEEVVPTSQRRRLSTRVSRGATKKPTYKEEESSDIEEETEKPSDDEAEPSGIAKRATQRGRAKGDPVELSEDSSLMAETTMDKKRGKTSQQRSSRATKRYRDDPSDAESDPEHGDEEEGDDDDDDSEVPAPTKKPVAKKPRTTTNRRSVAASSKTPNGKEESKTRGQAGKPKEPQVSAPRQSAAAKPKATGRQNGKNQTKAASLQSKLSGKTRIRAKASEETQDDTSQHSNAENDADIINISDDTEVVPDKPLALKGRRSVKVASEAKAALNTTSSALSVKGPSTPQIESPTPSVLAAGSPFRSRRRKSTGAKVTAPTTPSKRTVLDLSQDDEFNF